MTSQNYRLLNPVRKIFSTICLLVAASGWTAANANTISQTLGFTLNPAATTGVLSFQPFDLSLGTLESVGISFDVTRRHDWAIWNISGQTEDVAYADALLTGSFLTIDGTSFSFADLSYGAENTGALASVSFPTFFSEAQAGRSQFIAGSDAVYASAFNPASTLTNLTGSYAPLGFTTDLNLSYDPGFFSLSANNALAVSLVDVMGTATVTYTFHSVPDTSSGLTTSIVLVALFALARRRRAYPSQSA